jgi:hypothetical protein
LGGGDLGRIDGRAGVGASWLVAAALAVKTAEAEAVQARERFAQLLADARNQGYSVRMLSDATGISTQAVRRLLNGRP